MRVLFRYILLPVAAVLAASCSSDTTLEDEKVVDTRKPMVFGSSAAAPESVTRAGSAPLTANFKVSAWKDFGGSGQQVVMDEYEVDYTATATPYKWNYVDVKGQLQRYWDLAAFPYEFRAVSPYHATATSISTAGITIDASSKPFRAQSYINDAYNVTAADSEPYVVAHTRRAVNADGAYEDTDLIKNTEINSGVKANATREVHLPFHHLISKVGFRIFINDPQPSSPNYRVDLNKITISVVNAENNFVIASNTYSANNAQGLGRGTFTPTKAAAADVNAKGEYELLRHDSRYLLDNNPATPVNLRKYLHLADAFDMTPDCLHQIPQGNVKIRVQVQLETDYLKGTGVEIENIFNYDSMLSLNNDNPAGDVFTWEPDYRYIYVLHIPNVHGHEIFLHTCQILPWDDVQTADIPIGL